MKGVVPGLCFHLVGYIWTQLNAHRPSDAFKRKQYQTSHFLCLCSWELALHANVNVVLLLHASLSLPFLFWYSQSLKGWEELR